MLRNVVRNAPILIGAVLVAAAVPAQGGSVTVSHTSPALANAGPTIGMQSVTVTNDGTNLVFTIAFLPGTTPTVEGPSSGANDAVYGFINLDTDKSAGTGLGPAALSGPQGGFGGYTDSRLGIDAYISLSSEGDVLHGVPGLVDLIGVSNLQPIDTVAITYGTNSPATLSVSLPVSDFAALPGYAGLTAGGILDFSAIVGNLNNATDLLSSVTTTAVPEPFTIALGLQGSLALIGAAFTARRRSSTARPPRA